MGAGQASDERRPDIRAELESLRKDKEALRDELVELQGQKKQLEAQRATLVQAQATQAIGTYLDLHLPVVLTTRFVRSRAVETTEVSRARERPNAQIHARATRLAQVCQLSRRRR